MPEIPHHARARGVPSPPERRFPGPRDKPGEAPAGGLGGDPARREHFGEFYGLRPLLPEGRPVVVVHGNCQAGSVRRLLETAGAYAVRVPPVHELEAADLPHLSRLLAAADALVSQPVAAGYRGLPLGTSQLAHDLPGGARTVLFPVLRFAGHFPFQVTVRPAFASSIDPPGVPYHDLRTLLVAAKFPDLESFDDAAARRWDALTAAVGPHQVRALAQDSVAQLARRERAAGTVAVSPLLAEAMGGERTHHTLNHPTNAFFARAVRPILAALEDAGITGRDPAPEPPEAQMLGGIRAEIVPAVSEAFPAVAAGPWRVGQEALAQEDLRDAQLAWYRQHPGFVEAGLARHADALALLGLDRVEESRAESVRRAPGSVPAPPVVPGPLPLHLVPGDPEHGVNACALQTADALGAPVQRFRDALELTARLPAVLSGNPRVHLHFTDGIFGDSPEGAADLVERIAAASGGLTVTLHDVPQTTDGARNLPRRREAYARVVSAADLVVVNSRHELALLVEHGVVPAVPRHRRGAGPARSPRVAVIPLPLPELPRATGPGRGPGTEAVPDPREPTLGVFGFVYPGKGYEEAIDAAALLPGSPTVLAIGRIARGHADLVEALRARAEAQGVGFRVTGYVPEEDLPHVLASVDVPLCLHRHFSASGSVNSWIASGRRPLCVDSRYSREMLDLRPGTMLLARDAELPDRIRQCLADPALTWLPDHAFSGRELPEDAAPGEAVASGPLPGKGPSARPVLPHRMPDVARAYARALTPERPEVSVVIPYYDDGTPLPGEPRGSGRPLAARRLELLLDALARQAGEVSGPVERIVVDDGSPVPPVLPEGVVGLRQEDRGFRAGTARNLGALHARGRAVVFLDGDTVPRPGFLRALTAPVLAGTAQVTVGRREHEVLTGPEAGTPLESPAWLLGLWERTRNLAGGDARTYQGVISAVLAVDRWTLLAVGGFDESLTGYGGEDWEVAHRLWEAGAAFRHVPEARAVHDGPDWGERGGREVAAQRAVKNRETRALALRIPARWTRPPGLLLPVPELEVLLPEGVVEGEDRLAAWLGALLAAQPDATVRWVPRDPSGGWMLPELCAADPRVLVGPPPEPVQGEVRPRHRLVVHELFDPGVLPAALRELDAAPEDGPLGGASRRARVVLPEDGSHTEDARPDSPLEDARDGSADPEAPRIAATLVSARAHALEWLGQPRGEGLVVTADPFPEHPDLERRWAGW